MKTPPDILSRIEYLMWDLHLVGRMMNDDFNVWMESAAESLLDIMMSYIENEQPVWEVERGPEPIYGTTPSIRQGHKPISEAWERQIGSSEAGIEADLWNLSEHVQAVITGQLVDSYTISAVNNEHLVFWWGEPLPWPPRDDAPPGVRKRGAMIRGQNFWVRETAEGPELFLAYDSSREANPFMERAMKRATSVGDMTRSVGVALSGWLESEYNSRGFKRATT